jgi:hypothetical protein
MADKILVQELVWYTATDPLLEWQRLIPWINTLAQKKARGVFDAKRAAKALGDYLTRDVFERYAGHRKMSHIRLDASTKLMFGRAMLRKLMPRINTTAKRMRKLGLNKGKLVKEHPFHRGVR